MKLSHKTRALQLAILTPLLSQTALADGLQQQLDAKKSAFEAMASEENIREYTKGPYL